MSNAATATALALVEPPRSPFPADIDTEAPLPADVKAWVYEHGTKLLRALTNECASANHRLRETKLALEAELHEKNLAIRSRDRTIDELRRRLGDARGLADA